MGQGYERLPTTTEEHVEEYGDEEQGVAIAGERGEELPYVVAPYGQIPMGIPVSSSGREGEGQGGDLPPPSYTTTTTLPPAPRGARQASRGCECGPVCGTMSATVVILVVGVIFVLAALSSPAWLRADINFFGVHLGSIDVGLTHISLSVEVSDDGPSKKTFPLCEFPAKDVDDPNGSGGESGSGSGVHAMMALLHSMADVRGEDGDGNGDSGKDVLDRVCDDWKKRGQKVHVLLVAVLVTLAAGSGFVAIFATRPDSGRMQFFSAVPPRSRRAVHAMALFFAAAAAATVMAIAIYSKVTRKIPAGNNDGFSLALEFQFGPGYAAASIAMLALLAQVVVASSVLCACCGVDFTRPSPRPVSIQ